MSQPVPAGNSLRRNQAATSSTSTGANPSQRRRIDDSEANWMDVSSGEETDYSSHDESSTAAHPQAPPHLRPSQPRPHRGPAAQEQQAPSLLPRSQVSSVSLSSSSTLCETGHPAASDAGADLERAGSGLSKPDQKPLISYVTNEWQRKGDNSYDDEKHPYYSATHYQPRTRHHHHRSPSPSCCDEVLESSSWLSCFRTGWRRLTWRIAVVWIIILLLFHTGHTWFGSTVHTYSAGGTLRQSVQLRLSGGHPRGVRGRTRAWFGTQLPTQFQGLRQVGQLEEKGWQWANGKKLVIVGDVHGEAAPLEALLKKTKFQGERDHLAFVGDLVSKGPDTSQVLDIAMRHNASCVRGNHDDRLVLLHADLQGPLQQEDGDEGPATGKNAHAKERKLAATLSQGQIDYLADCPLILDLGELAGVAPRALMVHAGLIPGLPLEKQDPYAAMNMRSIDMRTHTPVKMHSPAVQRQLKSRIGDEYHELPPPWNGKKSKARVYDLDEKYVLPWRELWEEYQINLPKEDRTLAVYGHDSLVGLADGPWAVGLDSRCSGGGSLSALVLEMKRGKIRKSIVSVPCPAVKAEEKKERKKGHAKRGMKSEEIA